MGQIRLEEVAPFDPLGKLPDAGLLSFFAAFAGSGDVGLVLFSPPGSHIVPLETGNARPSTAGIDFSPRVLLPPFASKVLDYYSREYEALYNPLFNDFGSIQHGMLGFDRPDEGLIEPEEQILLRLDQRREVPFNFQDAAVLYFAIQSHALKERAFASATVRFGHVI